MPKRARSFKAAQLERLKDAEYAAEYINAAFEAGDGAAFLLALRNVAEARTMNSVAMKAGVSRESVYRMLSETGNPCFTSLLGIIRALGLQFNIQVAGAGRTSEARTQWVPTARSPVWEIGDRPHIQYFQRIRDANKAYLQPTLDFGERVESDRLSSPSEPLELVA